MSIDGVSRSASFALPEPEPDLDLPDAAEAEAPAAVRTQTSPSPAPDGAALRAEALEVGKSTRKSGGPEGTERVLQTHQRRRIEQLLERLDPDALARIDADLARLGGEDAPLARALYLKAAAARGPALLSLDDTAACEAALATLGAFADRLDGLSAEDLLARSTVLDLDSRVSTSSIDGEALAFSPKKSYGSPEGDTRTDNDGLFQRFTATCGSTTLQMALYEEDPIRAFAANDAGVSSYDPESLVGRFQSELLERYGGVAITREAMDAFARLRKGVAAARKVDPDAGDDLEALKEHVYERGPLNQAAKRGLEAVRAAAGGFPREADIERIQAAGLPKEDDGMGFEQLGKALNDVLSPVTGIRYEQTNPKEGLAKGQTWRHLDAAEKALKKGIDVPFGITQPPHWMLLTGVRGREPNRAYLISDPGSGITAWVKEKDFVKGTFIAKQFDMTEKGKDGFVDSLYLPADA